MSSLEGNEGNMGEIMGNMTGKSLQEKARLNTIPWDFPRGRNYSRGIGDTLHLSKIKVSSCQLKKTINTECFPFHTHSHRVFFGRK